MHVYSFVYQYVFKSGKVKKKLFIFCIKPAKYLEVCEDPNDTTYVYEKNNRRYDKLHIF